MALDKNCFSPTYDSCLIWTGPDMPFFNIKNGEKYSVAIIELATALQEHIERKINLKCLYTGECDNCSPIVEVPEAVQVIVNKLCELTTDDITNVGDLACLGINTLSPDAAKLLNRPMRFTVQPDTIGGANINYDYTEVLKNLPSNYTLGSVRTRVKGTMYRGSSVITDSDKTYVTSTVKADRFPLVATFEVNIITPSGNVKLEKSAVIAGTEVKEYTGVMEVHDFTQVATEGISQTKVNELISAELCQMRSELDQFKNLGISGLSCIDIASGDIKDIVGALVGAVEALCARIEDLEDKVNTEPVCGDCGES